MHLSAEPARGYQPEITLEEQELRDDPEAEEPALIYCAKGLDAEEAERVATTIMKDRQAALETMAREELGLDPSSARRGRPPCPVSVCSRRERLWSSCRTCSRRAGRR